MGSKMNCVLPTDQDRRAEDAGKKLSVAEPDHITMAQSHRLTGLPAQPPSSPLTCAAASAPSSLASRQLESRGGRPGAFPRRAGPNRSAVRCAQLSYPPAVRSLPQHEGERVAGAQTRNSSSPAHPRVSQERPYRVHVAAAGRPRSLAPTARRAWCPDPTSGGGYLKDVRMVVVNP